MSLSPSPAFGPCGIPEELEVPALEPEPDDVAAGGVEELVDFDEDEPPPQPATATAAISNRSAVNRRAGVKLMVMIHLLPTWTAPARHSFPLRRATSAPRQKLDGIRAAPEFLARDTVA